MKTMDNKRINDITIRIKAILIELPESRDNDMFLAATYWFRRLSEKQKVRDTLNYSMTDFMHMMRNYRAFGLTSYETISRLRRKIQQQQPELRGATYDRRQRMKTVVATEMTHGKTAQTASPSTDSNQIELPL